MNPTNPTAEATRRRFLQAASAGGVMAMAGGSIAATAEEVDSTPIPTRPLGKTGVEVPIMGVGTAPAGFRGRKPAAELFSQCLDAGLSYMDTAPEFAGYGKAQVALGDVLKTRRDEAFVVSKCWKSDGEEALKLLKQNLHDLQIDQLDLVYAHSLGADNMPPKDVLGPNGVMKALEKAQRDGLTRFIGVSGHNRPGRFLEVLKEFEIQVIMNAVSYVSRHIYNFEETVWPEAHRRGVALVAMKVYGGIKNKSGCRVPKTDVLDAFRYAQSLPNISTVVVGMHGEEELRDNLRFVRTYQQLSSQEMADLLERGKPLAKAWGEVFGPIA